MELCLVKMIAIALFSWRLHTYRRLLVSKIFASSQSDTRNYIPSLLFG